jgi:hypothetical protein
MERQKPGFRHFLEKTACCSPRTVDASRERLTAIPAVIFPLLTSGPPPAPNSEFPSHFKLDERVALLAPIEN